MVKNSPLGASTGYKSTYDKSLLYPIARKLGFDRLGIDQNKLPFSGVDIWNCYEVSWLNNYGLPQVRIMRFSVEANSENIIESKSLKLYLNSFNNHKFENDAAVCRVIKEDLSRVAGGKVEILQFEPPHEVRDRNLCTMPGQLIDHYQDVYVQDYDINKDLLKLASNEVISERLYSNLLKSNCLVTNQPDWASIVIDYTGPKIDERALLQYIVSYRNHSGFHEQCVENIFIDIMDQCKPECLSVYAKYTRRGGVDISPYRTNQNYKSLDMMRDIRQ